MEIRTTFEALEIREAPYVEEYKKKYGEWPVMTPKTATRLPTRFKTPRGETKFSMGEVYQLLAAGRVREFYGRSIGNRFICIRHHGMGTMSFLLILPFMLGSEDICSQRLLVFKNPIHNVRVSITQ